MRMKMLLPTILLTASILAVRPASATDLALVLLNDVSSSMDTDEFKLVKDGYRAAFSDPEVISAILGNEGNVAIAYVEFSDIKQIVPVVGWEVLTDAASAQAFGDTIAAAPRSSAGDTDLSAAVRAAANMLQEGDFGDARLVIDVASDLANDGGRTAAVRDATVAAGITINALPIITNYQLGTFDGHLAYSAVKWGNGSVADFYRRDVIGGAGSFVVEARHISAFGEALKKKLIMELMSRPRNRSGYVEQFASASGDTVHSSE